MAEEILRRKGTNLKAGGGSSGLMTGVVTGLPPVSDAYPPPRPLGIVRVVSEEGVERGCLEGVLRGCVERVYWYGRLKGCN